jgi:hypothetical protein
MVAALGWRGDGSCEGDGREARRKGEAKGRGGIYHQGDMGDVKAIAGGSDAYEAAGSQGRRLTEERWWKSFGSPLQALVFLFFGNFSLPLMTDLPFG